MLKKEIKLIGLRVVNDNQYVTVQSGRLIAEYTYGHSICILPITNVT